MKVTFGLGDDTVVTSNTARVTVQVVGQVGDGDRASHEQRAREITEAFIPSKDTTKGWAYSNFQYAQNGMTFQVNATSRIAAELNQQLPEKAKNLSSRNTQITVSNIDLSVPQHEMTEAENKLRKRMIERAQKTAEELGDFEVTRIDFNQGGFGVSNAKSFSASTYALDSAESAPLGHSEKISLMAEVTIRSRRPSSETNAKVVPLNG